MNSVKQTPQTHDGEIIADENSYEKEFGHYRGGFPRAVSGRLEQRLA